MVAKENNAEILKAKVLRRLKTIKGQVAGIEKMILTERDWLSIITQLTATRAAIESVTAIMLREYIKLCHHKDTEIDCDDCDDCDSIIRAIAISTGVRINYKV